MSGGSQAPDASFTRPNDPTPRFDSARERFQAAWKNLDRLSTSEVRPLVHFRLGAIALDVLGSAAALSDAHRQEISRWFADEAFSASDPRRLLPSPPHTPAGDRVEMEAWARRVHEVQTAEWRVAMELRFHQEAERHLKATAAFARFGATFKAFFYFTRAYQDVIYVALSNVQGRPIATGSMASALSEGNPVGRELDEALPEYPRWFRQWRDQRNRWKIGTGHHLVGPAPDIGIGFLKFDERTRGVEANLAHDIVRLGDATRAIDYSSEISEYLVQAAI